MNIRKNPKALAVFNKILAAEQTLESAKNRIPPCDGRERIDLALKILDEAGGLLEQFVEGMQV